MRVRVRAEARLLGGLAAGIGVLALAGLGLGAQPGSAAVPDAAPAAQEVVVDLSGVQPEEAARLAEAVPAWEEAIGAGTTRITITRDEADALRRAGFAVRIAALAEPLPPWPACYRRLADVYAHARALAAAHPDLLTLLDIGDSHCKAIGGCTTPGGQTVAGEDLLVMRVTNAAAPGAKGRLWVDAGIHAREVPTVELVMAFLEELVTGFGVDPTITALLSAREVHIGLVSNPDGRLLVEMGAHPPFDSEPWQWRKNGRLEGAPCGWPPTSGNHAGIDLNRNHDFQWDAEGHSDEPCAQTYRGTSPASEAEIKAFEDYVRTIFPDQRGPLDADASPPDATGLLVNYHNATYPGTVLVPWGWTTERTANDAELNAIARRYAAHNGYAVQYALYPVSGNTRDWGYGELGVPSYVIELQGNRFVTPCRERDQVLRHNLPAMLMLLSLADRPFERVAGPELVRVAARLEQGALRVAARASSVRGGRQAVAGAAAWFTRADGGRLDGLPHPAEDAEGLALGAADGAFDAASESLVGALDVGSAPAGRHLVIVAARDALGRAGPPVARWFEAPARRRLNESAIRRSGAR